MAHCGNRHDRIHSNKDDPYQCVPFLGSLEGFVQLGHAVILFEGHTNALPEVCENADMLIIDERMIQHMKKDWLPIVLSVMRNDYIIRVKVDDTQVKGAERLVLKS